MVTVTAGVFPPNGTKSLRRRLAAPALALLLGIGQATPASAHANLVRSEPPAGATIQASPAALVLVFSERIDPAFTRLGLIDSSGRPIDLGPGRVDPSAPTVLRQPMAGLPRDSYTIVWRARSDIDGHLTSGSVPFGIGIPSNPDALLPHLGSPDPTSAPPPPLDAVLRWLSLLSIAIALGGTSFLALVWQPAVNLARCNKRDVEEACRTMRSLVRRLILTGCACLAVVQVVWLGLQDASAAGSPPAAEFAAPLILLLQGRSGLLWLIRFGLTAGLAAWSWRWPEQATTRAHDRFALVLGGAIVMTVSLGGHSAALAEGNVWAIAADWIHVMAMVLWLGSLPPLWAAISHAGRDPEAAVRLEWLLPGYSDLAVVCVAVLLWTGIMSYQHHVARLDLLTSTTYGRALLLKLALFGLLLGLGATNFLSLARPLPPQTSSWLALRFRWTVAAEIVLGAALLAAVGIMTAVAPSRPAWEAEARAGIVLRSATDGVNMVLRVAPGLVGNNAVALDITDSRSPTGATAALATVLLRLSPPGTPSAPLELVARPGPLGAQVGSKVAAPIDAEQRYLAAGSWFTALGTWQVEAIVRRRGFDDIKQTFALRIVRSPADRLLPDPSAKAGQRSASGPASVAAGAALYLRHCQSCHGPSGRGDGPAASRLDPAPADLRAHVSAHEPAQLYLFIAEGIPGTAMPRFDRTLSRDDLWNVVNYLIATHGSP